MAQSTPGKVESMASDTDHTTREMLTKNGERVVSQARDALRSAAEEQKQRAARGLEGVARSMHDMARSLNQEEQQFPARYVDIAAEQIERGARLLQERGVEDLMGEVEGFARRQPAMFIGGAFAAGFLLARFLKSSDSGISRGAEYHAGRRTAGYGAQGMTRGYDYGEGSSYAGPAAEQTTGGGI